MTYRSFRLYARPSFWEGIARVLDVGGALNEYNYSTSPEEADHRALASDWEMVGRDLRWAVMQFRVSLADQENERTRREAE